MIDDPDDEDLQGIRADALALALRRASGLESNDDVLAPNDCPCRSGRAWADCCRSTEERAVERFRDRDRLYELRNAMVGFIAATPDVADLVNVHVSRWLEDAGAHSRDDEDWVGLGQIATEHAWIVGDEDDEEDTDGPFDLDSPLALFASAAATSPDDAAAARHWLEHCQYGLWQLADPTPGPGVWLTEIVTGARRYAAIAPEQLEHGALDGHCSGARVAIDGTWRTANAVLPLRPSKPTAPPSLSGR